MDGHVYKTVELTGSSSKSVEDAVNRALNKAAASIRNMRWFVVKETRGAIDGGKVAEWQVTIKVSFTVE